MPRGIGYGQDTDLRSARRGMYFDRIAQMLGGIGPGGTPEDEEAATRMALIAAGIQALSGAGTRSPLENLSTGLAAGQQTFSQVGQQRVRARQDERALGMDEERLRLQQEEFDAAMDALADDKKRREEAETVKQSILSGQVDVLNAIKEIAEGPTGEDPRVQLLISRGDAAVRAGDVEGLMAVVDDYYELLGDRAKAQDIRFFQHGGTVVGLGEQGEEVSRFEFPESGAAGGLSPSSLGLPTFEEFAEANFKRKITSIDPKTEGEVEQVVIDYNAALPAYQDFYANALRQLGLGPEPPGAQGGDINREEFGAMLRAGLPDVTDEQVAAAWASASQGQAAISEEQADAWAARHIQNNALVGLGTGEGGGEERPGVTEEALGKTGDFFKRPFEGFSMERNLGLKPEPLSRKRPLPWVAGAARGTFHRRGR